MENENCQFWEGYAGDDLNIPVQLIDENKNPMVLDPGAGLTDIVGEFSNTDGTESQVKYSTNDVSITNGTTGQALLKVPAATSSLMKASATKRQAFTVYTVINAKKRTWLFSILLKPRPVPSTS